jgi:RNA-binding protein YlmH
LLWEAEKSKGIFNPLYLQQKSENVDKSEYQENIEYIQNGLKIYRQSIGEKMRNFLRVRDELLGDIIKLNKYIEMVAMTRLPATSIFGALLLMRTVSNSNKV